MIRKALTLSGLMFAVAMAGQAKADSAIGTASIALTGTGAGLNDAFNLSFTSGGSTATYNANAFVGQLVWSGTATIYGSTSTVAGSTFCVQGMQDVYVNPSYKYSYSVYTLGSSAPSGGYDAGLLSSTKAALIQGFADSYYQYINSTSDGYNANINSAAFQLGLWELEYTGTGNSFSVSASTNSKGQVICSDALTAISLASTWLKTVKSDTSTSNTYVLENCDYQDQVYFCGLPTTGTGNTPTATPLPAALPTGLGVLATIVGVRKFRRKAVVA